MPTLINPLAMLKCVEIHKIWHQNNTGSNFLKMAVKLNCTCANHGPGTGTKTNIFVCGMTEYFYGLHIYLLLAQKDILYILLWQERG